MLVTKGDAVEEGDPLVVMEAMKMEHTIRAPCSGTVDTLSAAPNQQACLSLDCFLCEPFPVMQHPLGSTFCS